MTLTFHPRTLSSRPMRSGVDDAVGLPFQLASATIDIAIVCSDFPAAAEFYQRRLGLPVHADLEIPERLAVPSGLAPHGFRHLRLRAGNTLIKLMEIQPAPLCAPSGFQAGVRWLTFQVADLDSTIRHLSSRGVQFLSGRLEGLAGAFVCAQAPDDVLIEFVELYQRPQR
jgi:catechol 2,3-dioxygenase-like lactoylglutathione lyase family enzyme